MRTYNSDDHGSDVHSNGGRGSGDHESGGRAPICVVLQFRMIDDYLSVLPVSVNLIIYFYHWLLKESFNIKTLHNT